MRTSRKSLRDNLLTILVISLGLYALGLKGARVFAQDIPDIPKGNLQFSVDAGKIYFFQPETNRIFVYQSTTNRFSRLLILEKLGEDLEQRRSLSVIEENTQ